MFEIALRNVLSHSQRNNSEKLGFETIEPMNKYKCHQLDTI